jgi:hypothetical protein
MSIMGKGAFMNHRNLHKLLVFALSALLLLTGFSGSALAESQCGTKQAMNSPRNNNGQASAVMLEFNLHLYRLCEIRGIQGLQGRTCSPFCFTAVLSARAALHKNEKQ